MIRHAVLAFATVAILAGAPALAQQQQQQQPGREAVALDRSALIDARLAAMRAGLSLAPEQEELFAPVAETWRTVAQTRAERREAMRAERRARMHERFGGPGEDAGRGPGRGMASQGIRPRTMMSEEEMRGTMRRGFGPDAEDDFMVRLQRRAAVASARADELSRLAEAMQPFWDSLDDRQRALLPALVRGTEGLASPGRGGDRGMHGMRGRGWN